MRPDDAGAWIDELLGEAPPVRREPDARERIRALNVAAGRRIAVLDDDPTGSQTVHDVSVVTVFDAAEYAAGLADGGDTCFILTNVTPCWVVPGVARREVASTVMSNASARWATAWPIRP